MLIKHPVHLICHLRLVHASSDQQLVYLDGIEVEFVSYSLEGWMLICTIESYSCVHLILKDGTWVVVRLGRLSATTGFSFFRHHIASIILIFVTIYIFHMLPFFGFLFFISVTNYIHTSSESRVYDIFVEIFSTRQSSQNLITFGSWVKELMVATPFLK